MKTLHPLFSEGHLELAENQPLADRLTMYVLDRFHEGADVNAPLEISGRELLDIDGTGEGGLYQRLVVSTRYMMSAQILFEKRGEFKRLGLVDDICLADDTLRLKLRKNAAALISTQLSAGGSDACLGPALHG